VASFYELGSVVAMGADPSAYGTSRNLVPIEMGLL